jgi:teichuronic acid biosynthesis glycosyltransferase TuaC
MTAISPAINLARRLRLAVIVEAFPVDAGSVAGLAVFDIVREFHQIADVTVYYCRAGYFGAHQAAPQRTEVQGIPVYNVYFPAIRVLSRPFNGRNCADRLTPLLQEHRPDAILAFYLYPQGYAGVLAAGKLNIPAILVAMGSDVRQIPDLIIRFLTRRAVRRADCILAVSEDLRLRTIAMGVPPDRVHTVMNGRNSSVFHLRGRSVAREELQIPAGVELVVFVGRLVPIKRLGDLLSAARILAVTHPSLQIVCIGDGPGLAKLTQSVRRKRLTEVVRFIGAKSPPEIAKWLAACNVFCLPSESEGSPNVIFEALACGRPVVATDVGGIPSLVDSQCGILVKPKVPAALAQALHAALSRTWDEAAIASRLNRTWRDMVEEIHHHALNAVAARQSTAETAAGCPAITNPSARMYRVASRAGNLPDSGANLR